MLNKTVFAILAPLVMSGGGVAAQTAAFPPLGGPAIPGVCLLSVQAVLVNAKVAKAANDRLNSLVSATQAEVAASHAPIESEARALEADQSRLKPAEFAQRQQALATRNQAWQQTVDLRNREIQATKQKAVTQILIWSQPVLVSVYRAHNCGLLIDRNTVLSGNYANDLTPGVVAGLDAKVTTMTFDRETLSGPSGAGPAPQD